MNMFEMLSDEGKNYMYDEEELNSKIQNITYTSDTVRASYIPRKDIIECSFWQDDVVVYLTFVSTDMSNFSKNFSNEALISVTHSDVDCAEKFEEIFKVIFGVDFDRSAINVPDYVFSRGNNPDHYKYVAFYVYYHNTQINVCLWTKNGWEVFCDNTEIKKLANKMINYDERLKESFDALK